MRAGRFATAIAIAAGAATGGALAGVGAARGADARAPSPLIFPAETIPIAFDHAQHARLGATCEGCHQTASASTSAADDLIPPEAACRSCHKIDRTQPAKAVPKGQGAARRSGHPSASAGVAMASVAAGGALALRDRLGGLRAVDLVADRKSVV